MQMDDIGLLEGGMPCDVGAGIGQVYLKEILATEPVGDENAQTFPNEVDGVYPSLPYSDNGEAVGLLVAHQHLCSHSVLLQGLHESAGCYGRTADPFGCVDDEYLHVVKLAAKVRSFGEK